MRTVDADDAADRAGSCHDGLGVAAGWPYCDKNFADGHTIEWHVFYYDGLNRWSDTFNTKVGREPERTSRSRSPQVRAARSPHAVPVQRTHER